MPGNQKTWNMNQLLKSWVTGDGRQLFFDHLNKGLLKNFHHAFRAEMNGNATHSMFELQEIIRQIAKKENPLLQEINKEKHDALKSRATLRQTIWKDGTVLQDLRRVYNDTCITTEVLHLRDVQKKQDAFQWWKYNQLLN